MKLFSTHPPTGERIERLERLAEGDAGDAGEQRAAERLVRVAG
jgi:predicted Zn-dependent protease